MLAIPDVIALTRDLVRFDTINPPGNEDACARHLGALLAAAGFEVAYHAFAPGRTSLVARIGTDGERLPIGCTGHIDTVPLGAAPWGHEPLAGVIDDGKLYGRGTSDMKSGIAAMVVAALRKADALRAGPGVVLVITAGEETGCEGAMHLARMRLLGQPVGALVVAEPTANYPLVGHKGAFWVKAETAGVTAHGSMPERGDNAVYKAARAVQALEAFEFGGSAHPLMGRSTLNVGTIRGGLNINSVPDACEIGVDLRTVPGEDHAALKGRLQSAVGSYVRLTPLLDVGPVYTDPSHPWIQQVFDACAPFLGARPEPRSATYFTDASALGAAYRNPPTVILGPGEPQMAHQTDEYCVVERIGEAVEILSDLMAAWQRPN